MYSNFLFITGNLWIKKPQRLGKIIAVCLFKSQRDEKRGNPRILRSWACLMITYNPICNLWCKSSLESRNFTVLEPRKKALKLSVKFVRLEASRANKHANTATSWPTLSSSYASSLLSSWLRLKPSSLNQVIILTLLRFRNLIQLLLYCHEVFRPTPRPLSKSRMR